MALHMKLMVNGQQIGHLEIQRREPGRQTGDNVCHYDWRININGKTGWNLEDQPVAHRYGDGAWALVARVVEAAGYGPAAPSSAPETDREAALEAEARFWAAQDNDWRTEPAGRHVPAVQRWMALDLATALQSASTAGIAERRIAEVGWAQTWAELLAAVRATGAGHCGHDLEAFERHDAELAALRRTIADLAKTGDEALDELGRLGTDEGLLADNERLTAELDETRKRVAHYERCIDWDATCKACAAGLDISHELAMRAEQAEEERDRLAADNERLRARVHEAVDECQRRHAKYVSRCAEFEHWSAWARQRFEDQGSRYWSLMSEADRLVIMTIIAERDRLADAIRRVLELHSPEPGWEREWKDPAEALAAGWPLCRGCRTGTCARRVEDCPTLAALGDAAAAKPAACCDLHGRNCEPPSELCCPDCTEAAHDTFPIRHADGSTCSAPDLSGTQPEPGPARAGRFEELLGAEHEQFDRRSELLRSIVEYRDAPSTTVAALGDVGADPDGEQKTATTPDPDPGD